MADKLSKTDEAIDLEDYMLKMIKKEQRFSLSDKGLLSEGLLPTQGDSLIKAKLQRCIGHPRTVTCESGKVQEQRTVRTRSMTSAAKVTSLAPPTEESNKGTKKIDHIPITTIRAQPNIRAATRGRTVQ